jgi:hypothetical protein
MVPVDALSRYSIADGENGPPRGPEKATLVDGATTNVGGDCPVDFCAAASCGDSSIAGMPSETIEASRPVAMMVR